jgi:endonuclease-3
LEPTESSAKFATVQELLESTYGPRFLRPSNEPLTELISTILSQNTSDTNTARAFRSLREAFPTWAAIRRAETADVIAAIRSGGLANRKAPRIQGVLHEIHERLGSEDLGPLRELPLDDAKRWLTSLHGVGSKTAACVLLFGLGRPAMPVDTHVHRVSLRLGLVPAKTSPEATATYLEHMLGDDSQAIYAFHMETINHGRSLCRALRPACGDCPLREHCNYFQDHRHVHSTSASGHAQTPHAE